MIPLLASSSSGALPLLVWLSPAFPVGSFAYSHGLETAVHEGAIRDLSTSSTWLSDLVVHGGLRNDAVLLSAAWTAACDCNAGGLAEVNELALALAGSRERYLETSAQGNAFWLAIEQAWPCPGGGGGLATVAGDVAYPVAVGAVAAYHGIARLTALEAFTVAVIGNLTSVLVRLTAIGQTDGQRLICGLMPEICRLAQWAETASLEDLGGAAFLSDIAAMRHETLYSRLFRS